MPTLVENEEGFIANDLTFKTKTGYCHILPDKIVLTRDGIIGDMAKLTVGNNTSRILLIYALLAVMLLYVAFNALQEDIYGSAIIFIGVAAFLVYGIIRSTYHSETPVIAIEKIRRIQFTNAGSSGVSRAFFTIHFADEKGRIRKRLIALPGSYYSDEEETAEALEMMKSRFQIAERN
ncbi:hypothetical protein SAMN05421788_1011152 [Filimonas lacunae]|uniref:Phosphoribosylaminoimidazolesuccinocarboxamide synthase n=1 Tax=Filimonas lacunae TaxID=477680 RepID=A0A173MQF2_9BACT|nr:hypothetical protein [Filimonas lacunae]BAV09717.1 hypothetical protein FLA_5770 [Filimonas lacunae]SIS77780.1 hypothetical protein SAMN05421788_1011152 [Filimonas lacunae]